MALSVAERSRRYREAHPERAKAACDAWVIRNRQRVNAKNARWRKAHPEKAKPTPEIKAAKAKRYAIKHAEHLQAYHKRYQRDNQARLRRERQEYWQMTRKNRIRPVVEQRRAWINSFKNRPCQDCGGRFPPVAMDFDHTNGEKVSSVSQMIFTPEAVVLAEIDKCELVCANCHRVRTFNRRRGLSSNAA